MRLGSQPQPDPEISIGTCQDGDADMPGIVAGEKPRDWRALKAWHLI